MVHIFNRKHLFTCFSSQQQRDIQQKLTAACIPFSLHLKTVGARIWPNNNYGRMGGFGTEKITYEYVFYVKRPDFEAACYAIR